MRRETGHHTRVTEGAPRRLLAARGRLRYGSHDAGEADTTGRGVLRETRVRATEESPRGAGNPGGRRRTPAHSRRCPGTVPEVRRRAGARPLSGRRAGQVLALPGGVAGLRRARSGGGRGHWLSRQRPEDLRLTARCATCGAELQDRSEEHTSELQSQSNLVCRLLLEKKKE